MEDLTVEHSPNNLTISLLSDDNVDKFDYLVEFSPFRVYQRVNGLLSLVVNHRDSLYFENTRFNHGKKSKSDIDLINSEVNSDRCPYPVTREIDENSVKEGTVFSHSRDASI